MILIYIIKYVILIIIILLNSYYINKKYKNDDYHNFDNNNKDTKFSIYIENITNIPNILLTVTKINYFVSREYNLMKVIYYIKMNDHISEMLKPSDLTLLYDLHILCNIYISENNENLYSLPNIYENQFFSCEENINLNENVKFGIKIYKINLINEEIEFYESFFFTQKLINININPEFQNNNKFNITYLYENYNALLSKINKYKIRNKDFFLKSPYNLKISFLQPPLPFLKRSISPIEGRWYFNNVYGTYFCFCRGESCINIIIFDNKKFQSCKYYFYLTIVDINRNLYKKTDYLLSDFFNENIEPADAFPIFLEMLKKNIRAHYLTMSSKIYSKFFSDKKKGSDKMQIIYGITKINGDTLEKYLELFLRLKVVIAAEKFISIDNIFYNIDYISYIFLGHGVTYIKSFLYNNYLSPKNYNKILLPPSEKIISLALKAGWKNENIIKIGYPRWDNYNRFDKLIRSKDKKDKEERAIFMMFTWRKVRKGKTLSDLYFKNIRNILYNRKIKKELKKNNIKIFFCYHHCLIKKKIIHVNKNVRFIFQDEISLLLKNSSLIITDFSSILFDAIVQRKPLILYIPDGLETNLKYIYSKQYYEIITNLAKGIPYLFEVFLELEDVINKIIYYIQKDFDLENEKLLFYNEFGLRSGDNTRKFLNYIKMIN